MKMVFIDETPMVALDHWEDRAEASIAMEEHIHDLKRQIASERALLAIGVNERVGIGEVKDSLEDSIAACLKLLEKAEDWYSRFRAVETEIHRISKHFRQKDGE
jgi:hypothetical protein